MRFLHTADWHVGRTLRGRSRAQEHRGVLDEIAKIAGDEDVDMVIVAGDLFDLSAPTAESEEIVYRALLALSADDRRVVVVAGNHDSPQRLEAVRPLLDLTRVHLGAHVVRPEEGGVIDVRTRHGERARVALLPFLSQRGIIRAEQLMTREAAQHVQDYGERCRGIVSALCDGFDTGCVNVVVAHLAVVGGVMGGGEREAHTVFEYHVPPQIFPPTAHYVALGHLHRTQKIAGACPIWYAGAPLQLDFGEAGNDPGVMVVEAEAGTPAVARTVAVQRGKRLRTLRGSLDQLEALRQETVRDHLRIFVDEPARTGLSDEVRTLFPNAVDVIVLKVEEPAAEDADWTLDHVRRSPADLFAEFLTEKKVKDQEVAALFRELLTQYADET